MALHSEEPTAPAGQSCSQVNAHTSAIDALWAGVPIISLARESMASRVSASINSAAHMALTVARNADGELTFAQ